MNFSFYFFGTPEGRYSQYPDDYTASTLAGLQEGMLGARLVIFREMDLVHYAYTERLGNNNIIGFCLIFNKARIQKPRQLIRLFRFIIEKRLVESGEVIKYTDEGELKFKVSSMNECAKEYDRLKGFINSEFDINTTKYDIKPLTTIYNGTNSKGELGHDASDDQIVAMTNLHNKVIINDDEGIEHGYIPQLIVSLREQTHKAAKEITELKEDNAKLTRKKKQYSFVILLAMIILCCGIGLLLLNNTLNSTKNELIEANQTINNKVKIISELNSQIETKNQAIEREKKRYSNLEERIASVAPFVITNINIGSIYKGGGIETDFGNTLYRNRARYLTPKIHYRGFVSNSFTIKTKWYRPDGTLITGDSSPNGYSQSEEYSFRKGDDDIQLSGWGFETAGNWGAGTYKLEIWCNGKCIFVKSFTIYS